MDERTQQIIKTAIDLADEGGYEAVRLRDVANHAKVALGTLYKRFRSKEDMLVAALTLEVSRMEALIQFDPLTGPTPHSRVITLFKMITDVMLQRPMFSRAVLRAVASGEPSVADRVLRFQARMLGLVARTLQGTQKPPPLPEDQAQLIANLLLQIWFAGMVGWMGGQHDAQEAVRQVDQAASLMIAGVTIKNGL